MHYVPCSILHYSTVTLHSTP